MADFVRQMGIQLRIGILTRRTGKGEPLSHDVITEGAINMESKGRLENALLVLRYS